MLSAQKMKFSIKNFFSKCDQIRRKLQIWSHLLKKSLMENFIFCALSKINHYLTPDQNILLLSSVVKSQFNALNSIHEGALRLIYNNYELPFDKTLEDNKEKDSPKT